MKGFNKVLQVPAYDSITLLSFLWLGDIFFEALLFALLGYQKIPNKRASNILGGDFSFLASF